MKTLTWTETTADAFKNVGAFVADLATPTVRLGVTGLSRAGKTVFITALVRNLVTGGRLPFFSAQAQGRIRRAYLEPQPDDQIPRFAYEDHLKLLSGNPPTWPEGTKRISQVRVTIEYEPVTWLRRTSARLTGGKPSRLHIDIVDYPGEWIVDLGLLDLDFAAWSQQALHDARAAPRAKAAQAFTEFLQGLDLATADPEPSAISGARLFTHYLSTARAADPALSILTPGRFLMPGDLDGSPLLTFFPLPPGPHTQPLRGSLAGLLARRYESYKAQLVRPFFRDHFSRLDRQIVLMDALSALNQGPAGLDDLTRSMTTVLQAFRPGVNTLASALFRPRVDRILFAATKADHLNSYSHDRLEALMRAISLQAMTRASGAGATIKVVALAALRATREAEVQSGAETLPCIIGTPMRGERVADVVFDGKTETVLFPGDLPADPAVLFGATAAASDAREHDIRALTFQPPRIVLETAGGVRPALPHIRLDRAIEFLIGDHLA